MLKKNALFFLLTFFALLYAITMAQGLSWAYDSADAGDFLAAIATGGVPHPGGYPTYLFFASLFTKIPLGELAFRTNLFSMLSMLGAIVLAYRLVEKLTGNSNVATLSTLLFGSFPLVWSQALVTEVYASLTLLCLLTISLLLPKRVHLFSRDFFGGLTLGLAIGNHLTAVFLVPLLLLKNTQKYGREISLRGAGLLTGLSIFLSIPLRASNQAPINWGNAVDWEGFWWLVSGEMYQDRLSYFSFPYLYKAIGLWSQFLIDQIGLIGLAIAFTYIIVFFKPTRLHFTTLWLALVYSAFAILYYSPDSYVYLILPLFSFSLWVGLGIEQLRISLPRAKKWILALSIILVVAHALSLIPRMDISDDHQAGDFAATVLAGVPPKAIVLASGDEPTFSLWYYHYALKERPDIAIISTGLLEYEWYRTTLEYTYPAINLADFPSMQTFDLANPEYVICELSSILEPDWVCLLGD